jgi:hypothetical protein
MGPPSCMRSDVDRNVVMRRIPVFGYGRQKVTYGRANFKNNQLHALYTSPAINWDKGG